MFDRKIEGIRKRKYRFSNAPYNNFQLFSSKKAENEYCTNELLNLHVYYNINSELFFVEDTKFHSFLHASNSVPIEDVYRFNKNILGDIDHIKLYNGGYYNFSSSINNENDSVKRIINLFLNNIHHLYQTSKNNKKPYITFELLDQSANEFSECIYNNIIKGPSQMALSFEKFNPEMFQFDNTFGLPVLYTNDPPDTLRHKKFLRALKKIDIAYLCTLDGLIVDEKNQNLFINDILQNCKKIDITDTMEHESSAFYNYTVFKYGDKVFDFYIYFYDRPYFIRHNVVHFHIELDEDNTERGFNSIIHSPIFSNNYISTIKNSFSISSNKKDKLSSVYRHLKLYNIDDFYNNYICKFNHYKKLKNKEN